MEREQNVVAGFLLLQFVMGLGFVVHQSPRFPGSFVGGMLGVLAAALMLLPLPYVLVKRVEWLKVRLARQGALPILLRWHVYSTVAGATLGILHSGHRFQSRLGILLTAAMLCAVLSGYIGRHFLRYVSRELKDRQDGLLALRAEYPALTRRMIPNLESVPSLTFVTRLRRQIGNAISGSAHASESESPHHRVARIADAIAELEYAVAADETIRNRLRIWLAVHIGSSFAFYLLLILHIGASIQFGLRWFS